jgi:hypothetical protein
MIYTHVLNRGGGGVNSRLIVYDNLSADRDKPPPLDGFGGAFSVEKLRWLVDIATDLDFIGGAGRGDKPTGFCRR